jgi:ligand-binding sensor domain-containing protein
MVDEVKKQLAEFKQKALALRILRTSLARGTLPTEEPFAPVHPAWKTYANFRHVNALAVGHDELWAVTWGGVIRWRFNPTNTFTRFGSEHGLPGHHFDSLALDKSGGVWVGGSGVGLSYFDGHRWRTFTTDDGLPSKDVLCITTDPKGQIWVSTRQGIGYMASSSQKWKWHDHSLENVEVPAYEAQTLAIDPDGTLWLGTDWGLYNQKSDGTSQRFTEREGLPDLKVTTVLLKDPDSLWIGTSKGLATFDSASIQPCSDLTKPILNLSSTSDGSLWVVTPNEVGIYSANGWQPVEFKTYLLEHTLPQTIVADQGKIWAGYTTGAVQHHPTELLLSSQDGENKLGNCITALQTDTTGRLWVGTPEGLWYFQNETWRQCRKELSAPLVNINAIMVLPTTKQLWVGGWRHPNDCNATGLRTFRVGSATEISIGQAPKLPYVDTLTCEQKGNLWVAAEGVIHCFDSEEWTELSLPSEAINEAIQAVAVDRDGVLWCGTTENLWRFDQDWAKVSTEAVAVQALLVTETDLWVGTALGLKKLSLADQTIWLDVVGLPPLSVTTLIAEPDGTIWAGTTAGLARISEQECQLFTAGEHGLANNFVQSLALDGDYLWVGTANGLSRFILK